MKRENSVANFGVILSDGIRLLLKWHSSILNIDYMYLFLKNSLALFLGSCQFSSKLLMDCFVSHVLAPLKPNYICLLLAQIVIFNDRNLENTIQPKNIRDGNSTFLNRSCQKHHSRLVWTSGIIYLLQFMDNQVGIPFSQR